MGETNLQYVILDMTESILNFWAISNSMDQFEKAHNYAGKFLEVRGMKLNKENVKKWQTKGGGTTGYLWSFVKVCKCSIPDGHLFDKKKQILNLLQDTAD
ncbi:uncharacterized protein G2W53_032999 [Senna tora]|uniref:Uncharacterized protein n=1 Tax=Senna tora TaxID=362788 RepID=A0A834SYG8_9FABA|nr:uncharacterized protein G2W53_032999 [Senna tora]